MTAKEIYDGIRHLFATEHHLQNVFMFNWESDVFFLTKSGLSVEIEVKVSRSDFFADFYKPKHKLLSNHKADYISLPRTGTVRYYKDDNGKTVYGHDSCQTNFVSPADRIPNRFYYACPSGMIKPEEIPPYAGLIYVPQKGESIFNKVVKRAPLLHKQKRNWDVKLMDKYYWRRLKAINEIAGFQYSIQMMGEEHALDYLSEKLRKVLEILR